jgi:hypothetical protein
MLANKLSSLESAVQEIQEFQKNMKQFQKGGLVVTYHSSAGFLLGELKEFSDEILAEYQRDLLEEADKIAELLRKK